MTTSEIQITFSFFELLFLFYISMKLSNISNYLRQKENKTDITNSELRKMNNKISKFTTRFNKALSGDHEQ